MNATSKVLSVRLTTRDFAEVERLAAVMDRSRSDTARRALVRGVRALALDLGEPAAEAP